MVFIQAIHILLVYSQMSVNVFHWLFVSQIKNYFVLKAGGKLLGNLCSFP